MLQGLSKIEGGQSALPFVSMFYGSPPQYLWEDERGVTHTVHQGEGGEQGDAMMPLLYSLGQHGVLEKVQAELQEDEVLLALLDDTYIVTSHERTAGAPQGGGLEGWRPPEGWEAQNRAFFPLPPQFSFILPVLGVHSWNFGGARLEFSGCRLVLWGLGFSV